MNEELLKAYKEINRASDIVGDVMAGIYSGDEHDEAMENFLLAIDQANDELTKLVARCIRVGSAEISADVYRGKRYETEKKISTDNLMVGTISPKYQFDNSGKSPKTNERKDTTS